MKYSTVNRVKILKIHIQECYYGKEKASSPKNGDDALCFIYFSKSNQEAPCISSLPKPRQDLRAPLPCLSDGF